MPSLPKSQASVAIEEKLRRVPKNTPRHRALEAAHTFKASWVRLGETLSEVRQTHAYREWGYAQFALYCRQELHIREETARKLTRSYGYLQEHAPETLAQSRGGEGPAPALDVVDLLRQARARTQIDPEAWAAVQRDALTPSEGHVSRQQVLARLREACPSAFDRESPAVTEPTLDETPAAEACAPIDKSHARKVLLLAERLHALLSAAPSLADEAERAAVSALAKSLRRHAGLPKAAHAEANAAQAAAKLYSEGALH